MRTFVCTGVVTFAHALRSSNPEALGALAELFGHAPANVPGSQGQDVGATSNLMRQLGSQSGPHSPILGRAADPSRHYAFAACEREFEQPCPDHFVTAGPGKCAPGPEYDGPCSGDTLSLDGLSPIAKGRWSELCLAWWPCVECQREFSDICPKGWERGEGTECKPSAGYLGPCAAPTDFAGYSKPMLAQWSLACGAHWPCAGDTGAES